MSLLGAAAPAWGADGCPEVAWPPGIDLGAQRVTGTLTTDGEGLVVAAEGWEGEPVLVDAVIASLGDCALPPDTTAELSWSFPEPSVNVAGLVRASGDRSRVPGLTIIVGERTARTDADGRFELRNVTPGPAVVRVADPGWRLTPVEIDVATDQRTDLELWVIPELARLDELVARYRRSGDVAVARVVDIESARAIPGSLNDPLRALSTQAGLTRPPFDSGWLLVRGGDFDDTGQYIDGVRVPLIWHLGGFTSVLHPEMTEAIKLYPGVMPSRYGDAISGAVDVIPRQIGDRARAVGGMNLVFAHAFAEAPTPWGGVAVAARRSYLDGVLALVLDPEAAQIAPRFWDAQARATFGDASLTLFGLSDGADAPSFSGDGILSIRQQAFQVQARVPAGDWLTVQPWFAWTLLDVTGDVVPQKVEEVYPGVRVEAKTPRRGPGRLIAGVEAQRRTFELERSIEERGAPLFTVDPYVGATVGTMAQVWAELRWNTLATGGQPFRGALDPRTGARWRVHPLVELHTAFGRFHQLPPPTLMIGLAEGIYLPLEQADEVEVGTELGDDRLSLMADAWVREMSGLAELEFDGSVGRISGRAMGVESKLSGGVGQFEGSVLYQLTRSRKREEFDDPLVSSPFEVPHRFEVLAVQRLPRNWLLSGHFRYNSGFARRVEDGRRVPDEAYDLLTQQTRFLDLDPSDRRLAPFHALDVMVARTFVFRSWRLEASLTVKNVYNRRVVEPFITGFGETRPAYGFGLPVLPIFGVEGEFWPGRPP